MAKKTKKEWVEWFNSIDDDVIIDIQIAWSNHSENGKLKKNNNIRINNYNYGKTMVNKRN